MSESPPKAVARRPRYLSVALAVAILMAIGCIMDGFARLAFYRLERDGSFIASVPVADESQRPRLEELWHKFEDVADKNRQRALPLASATLVLGLALFAFASRGLSGRSNARNVIVQLVLAQAAVVAGTYFLLPAMRDAELDWNLQRAVAQQAPEMTPGERHRNETAYVAARRYGPPSWLALRSLASLLVVFALTRPRSREFFEANADRPIPE